eukprot:9606373-Alexandrium_andersonii.AAC.1
MCAESREEAKDASRGIETHGARRREHAAARGDGGIVRARMAFGPSGDSRGSAAGGPGAPG